MRERVLQLSPLQEQSPPPKSSRLFGCQVFFAEDLKELQWEFSHWPQELDELLTNFQEYLMVKGSIKGCVIGNRGYHDECKQECKAPMQPVIDVSVHEMKRAEIKAHTIQFAGLAIY